MKILLKLLFAPVIVTLTLFVWICSGLIYCSAWVFGIAGTLLGILAAAVLITTSVQNGIILLVMAFLISPLGVPMIAVKLLGLVQRFRLAIQDRIY